jgi:hypothetical protein
VAQANLRLAAGIGVVATCLLIGGPSVAVVMADPSGGHSGRSDNSKGSNRNSKDSDSSSRRSSPGSRGSDWSDDNINSGSRSETNSGIDDRPSSRVGSGREAGTSDERPSSDYSPDPPQFKKPKVTFGDGRTPGIQDNDPEPRWSSPAPEPAPPPPPPEVITVPLNPPAISPVREQSGVVQRLVVAPTAGIADPLWGVAGLLLIPAAGAILGHRQARAAQSAAQLARSSPVDPCARSCPTRTSGSRR